jgi:uncharacterized protein (TIGR02466 family)
MTARIDLVPLFATPVAIADLAGAAQLNAALRAVIAAQRARGDGTRHSNLGGWQSDWEMARWGGDAAATLLDAARGIATRITADRAGRRVDIAWKANMWANVNRRGDANEFHAHPGSFWSAVYYVDDGGIGADPTLGGELEFMDPRGAGPAMYAPHLAFATPGGLSVGSNETIAPKSGRLVMFPAWLLHQVRPYRGDAERISVALNLSV